MRQWKVYLPKAVGETGIDEFVIVRASRYEISACGAVTLCFWDSHILLYTFHEWTRVKLLAAEEEK